MVNQYNRESKGVSIDSIGFLRQCDHIVQSNTKTNDETPDKAQTLWSMAFGMWEFFHGLLVISWRNGVKFGGNYRPCG